MLSAAGGEHHVVLPHSLLFGRRVVVDPAERAVTPTAGGHTVDPECVEMVRQAAQGWSTCPLVERKCSAVHCVMLMLPAVGD